MRVAFVVMVALALTPVSAGLAQTPPSTRLSCPTCASHCPTGAHCGPTDRAITNGRRRGIAAVVFAGAAAGLGITGGALALRYRHTDPEARRGVDEGLVSSLLPLTVVGLILAPGAAADAGGGRRGLHLAGWISFVLFAGGAFALLIAGAVASFDVDIDITGDDPDDDEQLTVPPAAVFGLAAAAATSMACFGANALLASNRARARRAGPTLAPVLALWRESHTASIRPALGVRMVF